MNTNKQNKNIEMFDFSRSIAKSCSLAKCQDKYQDFFLAKFDVEILKVYIWRQNMKEIYQDIEAI